MNTGIVASRYALALLKYVREDGTGKKVYSQSCILVGHIGELPQLRQYLEDASDVTFDRKISLMTASLGEAPASALVKFLKLVIAHRREDMFTRMLLSFIEQYRRENNIKVGNLVTAVSDEGLCERLETLFHDRTGAEVHLEEKVDPDVVGGFAFELDGYRLDATVSGHLARIRRQLVEKNNRIV